jgi:hypothetical protein
MLTNHEVYKYILSTKKTNDGRTQKLIRKQKLAKQTQMKPNKWYERNLKK